MNYTNKHELPDAFFRAVVNDPYNKGEAEFSATQLQNPARAIVLMELHKDKIEIDVSTRVAATIGQGVHSILERAARPDLDVIETRFMREFYFPDGSGSVTVSAQIDLFEKDTCTLYDWKTTKAFAFHKRSSPKFEWEAQLNIGALIIRESGLLARRLSIIGLLKDWDYNKGATEPGYPATEVMELEIPMWDASRTMDYIFTRARAIRDARLVLPECTGKETWGGNRCRRWCDVSSVCFQWNKAKQTGVI